MKDGDAHCGRRMQQLYCAVLLHCCITAEARLDLVLDWSNEKGTGVIVNKSYRSKTTFIPGHGG
jgi:hypothetical protein